jgi:hypothetical protein
MLLAFAYFASGVVSVLAAPADGQLSPFDALDDAPTPAARKR